MQLTKLKELFGMLGIKLTFFILPALLSLLSAFCEGISIGVLIPTAKGILTMNFDFVRNLPIFKDILNYSSGFIRIGNTVIFILLIVIIFSSALLKNVLQYAASLVVSKRIRRIENVMRKVIFERYLSLGKLFFDQSNSGYLQSILLTFVNMIINQMHGAEVALSHLFMLVIYLCLMFMISFRLTLIVLILTPVLYYSVRWIIEKLKKTSSNYTVSFRELNNKVANILSCIPLVKLYANEKNEKKHFSVLSDNMERIEISLDKKMNLIPPLQEIILLMVALFLISFMSFMVVKEKAGEVASFLVYFYILRMSLRSFGIFNSLVVNFAIAKGPITEISNILDDKGKFFVSGGEKEFTGLKEGIEFRHLNFSYYPGQPVLKDLSLIIEKGKMTALVGPTGAGKTSLISLILRLYDCSTGSIFIDGIDIRNFSLHSLMSRMALVSQDTLLFNDTLRNNIIYGLEKEIPEARLFEVLKQARLYNFVIGLPSGLNTFIGDKGVQLSGGEKQRVAIARALLKEAEILILDEATSSLDTATEKLIQESIEEVIKDKTTIVIAHRLSTIKNADKIAVIEGGRVAEEGSLEALLQMKGKFFNFWEAQKFY